ncbi:hypothetical protein [Herbaspirillum sp. C9C3]|uniref:hypothetical protein n=1 Tax=Herbaspirillum sp. C9C3 TaxID=2735271 RepID=UPI0015850B42|nr:hypothetical protein [Herbaspirillum sp. C9C3]NUT60771.1 hypothetical protein [Herbaspirillum sp. C9C3]
MMLRAKLLLLWLLMLAIPVQGLAAMLQACAPGQRQSLQHHASAMPHAHQAHQAHQTHQGHHADHLAAAQVAAADDTQTQHHQQPQAHGSCSFCAACTVGGLLPLALTAPPAPDLPSREFIALPASGFVGYLPENPDRPPALA